MPVALTISSAADCRPRRSPPAASAASSAAIRRSARSPLPPLVGGEHRRPDRGLAHHVGLRRHAGPDDVAGGGDGGLAGVRVDAALGVDHRHLAAVAVGVGGDQLLERLRRRHARIASRPGRAGRSPGSTNDCVATTPTPASPHVTIEPTENQCDCTATPELAGLRIAGDDRIGVHQRTAWRRRLRCGAAGRQPRRHAHQCDQLALRHLIPASAAKLSSLVRFAPPLVATICSGRAGPAGWRLRPAV